MVALLQCFFINVPLLLVILLLVEIEITSCKAMLCLYQNYMLYLCVRPGSRRHAGATAAVGRQTRSAARGRRRLVADAAAPRAPAPRPHAAAPPPSARRRSARPHPPHPPAPARGPPNCLYTITTSIKPTALMRIFLTEGYFIRPYVSMLF